MKTQKQQTNQKENKNEDKLWRKEFFNPNGAKFSDWLIGIIIGLLLVLIPIIISMIYNGISEISSIVTILALIIALLIVNVRKDKREKGSSQYSSITKYVIIFFILVDVIAITIFIINPPFKTQEQKNQETINNTINNIISFQIEIEKCRNLPLGSNIEESIYQQIECIVSTSKQYGTIEDCNSLEEEFEYGFCVIGISHQKNDVLICNKLEEVYLVDDISFKDYCLSSFGFVNGDEKYCDMIVDMDLKETCKLDISKGNEAQLSPPRDFKWNIFLKKSLIN